MQPHQLLLVFLCCQNQEAPPLVVIATMGENTQTVKAPLGDCVFDSCCPATKRRVGGTPPHRAEISTATLSKAWSWEIKGKTSIN